MRVDRIYSDIVSSSKHFNGAKPKNSSLTQNSPVEILRTNRTPNKNGSIPDIPYDSSAMAENSTVAKSSLIVLITYIYKFIFHFIHITIFNLL